LAGDVPGEKKRDHGTGQRHAIIDQKPFAEAQNDNVRPGRDDKRNKGKNRLEKDSKGSENSRINAERTQKTGQLKNIDVCKPDPHPGKKQKVDRIGEEKQKYGVQRDLDDFSLQQSSP
jgi:hypothetical protein